MQPTSDKGKLRHKVRATTYRVFNDDAMIGLAAILLCFVIIPVFFDISSRMQSIFDYTIYIIVAAFVVEYFLKLYVAESRISFVTDLWHFINLLIIILASLDLLNLGPDLIAEHGKLAIVIYPFLAFILASRTLERAISLHPTEIAKKLESELQIITFDQKGHINRTLNGESRSSLMPKGDTLWVHFQDVKSLDLEYIEKATSIPQNLLESKLIRRSLPKIEFVKGIPSIFLWDSEVKLDDHYADGAHIDIAAFNIETNGILIACVDDNIITLSTGKSDLFDRILSHELPIEDDAFRARILLAIIRQKIEDYGEIIRSIEGKAIQFEEMPVNRSSPKFLEETFYFKKEIQKTISNLWHFNRVVHHILEIKNPIFLELSESQSNKLDSLYAESEYLYETAQNTRDSLISLIELHINTVSYDMNRVIKIVAVITCLALIPSIIGGLLGVNLTDGPYPLKITEVFFLVFFLMLICLYIFYKMDWLK
jgi:Mg2+ and Co2+ transporter CorA